MFDAARIIVGTLAMALLLTAAAFGARPLRGWLQQASLEEMALLLVPVFSGLVIVMLFYAYVKSAEKRGARTEQEKYRRQAETDALTKLILQKKAQESDAENASSMNASPPKAG